jgi:hypothetical protein
VPRRLSPGFGGRTGCSSYAQIGGDLRDAVNDAGGRAILLQVDSPGGKTTGGLELSDFIYSIRGVKPIYAVADDFVFSASYALTSAADRIFITRMGAVASVAVVVLHTEDSKLNDEQGFKYTYIFKGDRKVDGSPIIDRQAPVDAGASHSFQKRASDLPNARPGLADDQIGICTLARRILLHAASPHFGGVEVALFFPWRSPGLPTYSPCRCRRFPTNRGSGLGCRRREACWCPRRRPKGYGWSRSSEQGLPTVALVAAQPILSKLDYH